MIPRPSPPGRFSPRPEAASCRPRPPLAVASGALALIALSGLLSSAVSFAATYVVDGSSPTCSDAGPGTEETPYCTLPAAMAAHNGAGVTIRVKPGEYVGSFAVPRSGAEGSPFVLQAEGAVIQRGSISISGRSWVVLDGFTVRQGLIQAGGASHVTITHNVVDSGGVYGIYATNVASLYLARNTVSNCVTHGIRLRDVTASVIEDNTAFRNGNGIAFVIDHGPTSGNRVQRNRVYDNVGSGLYYSSGSFGNLSIQNLAWGNEHGIQHSGSPDGVHIGEVVWGNTDDGISLKNGSTGNAFWNCIVGENGLGSSAYALYADTTSTGGLVSNDNLFWNSNGQALIRFGAQVHATLAGWVAATGLDTRTIGADPRFVDAAAGDFHLDPGSPAIDCANSGLPDWPATDADGQPRVDDPATPNSGIGPTAHGDRGAFEFVPAALDVNGPAATFAGFQLAPVAPNPSGGTGRFAFTLPVATRVRLAILDLQGRVVATLAEERLEAGRHQSIWNGRTGGQAARPGLYFVRLEAPGVSLARKFVIER